MPRLSDRMRFGRVEICLSSPWRLLQGRYATHCHPTLYSTVLRGQTPAQRPFDGYNLSGLLYGCAFLRRAVKYHLGIWRILCVAQIEHKRISVYARSANPKRPPERISPCSSSLYSMRPNCGPLCVGCTCSCTSHHGSLGYASPMRWWSPQHGPQPSPVCIASVSRLPTPRMERTRYAAVPGQLRTCGLQSASLYRGRLGGLRPPACQWGPLCEPG
jgi:hypothetical protein